MRKRDGFSSKVGFVLACVGAAIGMGNLWRFPSLVSSYGGLTFIIPYLLFVLLVSKTGVIEEFALGRAAQTGPVGAFGWATAQRGNEKVGRALGLIPVLGSLAIAIGYTVVMGWVFKYAFLAVTGGLSEMGQDMNVIGGTFDAIAGQWGNNVWIIIACGVAFGIMSFGVASGIEKANRIMMPILFFLLIGLAIYIAFLPGARDGFQYILTIKPEGLLDSKVWIYAFGQAFFSLCVAGNGSVIYGSYLRREESIPDCASQVAIFDTVASVLAALVIIPAMATTGQQLSSGGPGLMFIYLVNVFNGMAAGRIVSIVFYFTVCFAAVSSIINLYEAPVEYVQNRFHAGRLAATALVLSIGGLTALCIQQITSQWMDVVSIYVCPLGALLAGIMFFWVIRREIALQEVNAGASKPLGNGFYFTGKYVYVCLSLLAIITGALLGGIG